VIRDIHTSNNAKAPPGKAGLSNTFATDRQENRHGYTPTPPRGSAASSAVQLPSADGLEFVARFIERRYHMPPARARLIAALAFASGVAR
jgi:hypothetical protein